MAVQYHCGWEPCSHTFANPTDLDEHIMADHSGEFPCGAETCEKRFKTRKALNTHKHRCGHWTNRDPTWSCGQPDCSVQGIHREIDLLYHQKNSHPELYPIACPVEDCDFRTNLQRKLIAHQLTHKDKPECRYSDCNSRFLSNQHRSVHEEKKTIHPLKLLCDCPGCNIWFDSEQKFDEHKAKHVFNGNPYLCNAKTCDESFGSLAEQFSHEITTHRRSVCNICQLTFAQPKDAVGHGFSEHSTLTFCCGHCLISFTRLNNYIKHAKQYGDLDQIISIQLHPSADREGLAFFVGNASLGPNIGASERGRGQAKKDIEASERGRGQAKKGLDTTIFAQSELGMVKQLLNMSSVPLEADISPLHQQFTVGRRLQSFKHTFLAVPKPLAGTSGVGGRLPDLLKGGALRTPSREIVADDEDITIDFHLEEEDDSAANRLLRFSILHLKHHSDTVLEMVGGFLHDILERIPTSALELPWTLQKWLLDAAFQLAMLASPDLELQLTDPRLLWDKATSLPLSYSIPIHGFDPTSGLQWAIGHEVMVTDRFQNV